jgi:hypothetical protein
MAEKRPEYVLTIAQHTYCSECTRLKGRIADVYRASGIVRGEDSKHWRVQIISPPWDRSARQANFPNGFDSVDLPALKLEVDNELIFATQNPRLIEIMLIKLKWMLMNRLSNSDIEKRLLLMARDSEDLSEGALSCGL